jgi:hypothetical protein
MKKHALWILLAGSLFSGCKQEFTASNGSSNSPSSGNPVTAPVDYLGAVGKAKQSADKVVSTVGIDQAIKMFSAQEGRMPKDLNELVPTYLPRIPSAPAGMKYSYDPGTGAVKIVRQ